MKSQTWMISAGFYNLRHGIRKVGVALCVAGIFFAGNAAILAQAPNSQGNQSNSQLNGGTGTTPGVARVNVAPGNYNGGGIRYVTVETPTQYQQTRVRNFFAGGGIYTGRDATVQSGQIARIGPVGQVASSTNNRRQAVASPGFPAKRLAPLYARR